MLNRWLFGALALGAAAWSNVGCVAHAQVTGSADANAPVVFTEAPTLVSVDSDLWIVRDYDYAVYYVDDYYWVYRGDKWHRSRSYDSGWAVVEVNVVPTVIVHRDHQKYVHYRGSVEAKTRPAPREHLASSDGHQGPPDHAAEKHDGPPGQDKDKTPGPPEHAGGPHDGPPGHDEVPGVGNQRKADEGGPTNARNDDKKKDDKKDDKKKKDEKKK